MSVQLHFLRLPRDISQCFVVLMDATVATGAAAIMAIRVLLVSLAHQLLIVMSFPRIMMCRRTIFCLCQ